CISMPPGPKREWRSLCGPKQGGLTMKIHARVDAKGRPVCLLISPGEVYGAARAEEPCSPGSRMATSSAAKRPDWQQHPSPYPWPGCGSQHPEPIQPQKQVPVDKGALRERNRVEHLFNSLKQFRRIATATTSSAPTSSLSSARLHANLAPINRVHA